MQTALLTNRAAGSLILLATLTQSVVHSEAAIPAPFSPPSIDGTYELTERVMANGTVLRPPSIVAFYTVPPNIPPSHTVGSGGVQGDVCSATRVPSKMPCPCRFVSPPVPCSRTQLAEATPWALAVPS